MKCRSIRAKLSYLSLGQVKFSLDKYIMVIYLSLDKYQIVLFSHPCKVSLHNLYLPTIVKAFIIVNKTKRPY